MHYRIAIATALMLSGVAGCTSAPPAPRMPDGALPAGTAQVTVNGSASNTTDVSCQSLANGFTTIDIGDDSARVAVIVDRDVAKGVSLDGVAGFTGSYWQDLQGTAQLAMIDQTYTLTGTADGFNSSDPHNRTTDSFTVTVAC